MTPLKQARLLLPFMKIVPVHEPMQKVDAPFSNVAVWLSKGAPVGSLSKLRPHGVLFSLYQGEIYTWKLCLGLRKAAPRITFGPT